jgi:ketosteroid isomerase-like protein
MHKVIIERGKRAALLILLSSSLWGTAQADSIKENLMNNETNQALQTVELMTAAFHNKDIKGVLSHYEKGAAIMFEAGSPITDPEILKQMFEGAFQINPTFKYPKGHEVYVANDIALHIAPWKMNGVAPDGSAISDSGLSVAVLRKQANGRWLMVLDNPNSQALMD